MNQLKSFLKVKYILLSFIAKKDKNVHIIRTNDLMHKGDYLHFDSESQRLLGKRIVDLVEIK